MESEVIKNVPVVVYAESTPNPAAMKFVANKILLEGSIPLEFFSAADAKSSPLVTELFKFPFVKSVFISGNYITVFKTDKVEWDDIMLELREFLRTHLSEGKKITGPTQTLPFREGFDSPEQRAKVVGDLPAGQAVLEGAIDHVEPKGELEVKIVNILEQYIRPAVEQDGGMIVFRSFKDGIVSLTMRGACSGCPSSTSTLKGGIEALLKKFIPEVKSVVSE